MHGVLACSSRSCASHILYVYFFLCSLLAIRLQLVELRQTCALAEALPRSGAEDLRDEIVRAVHRRNPEPRVEQRAWHFCRDADEEALLIPGELWRTTWWRTRTNLRPVSGQPRLSPSARGSFWIECRGSKGGGARPLPGATNSHTRVCTHCSQSCK